MKKFSFVALFAIVAFGAAFAVSPQEGSVALSGKVLESFTITVPEAYENGTMDDTAGTVNTWTLGNVKVYSNVKNWTFTVSSTGNSNLISAKDANEKVAYRVTLGNLINDQSIAGGVAVSNLARTPKTGTTYALSVKFTADQNSYWEEGAYSDTIKFTITHN